jgi:hypothetical protein
LFAAKLLKKCPWFREGTVSIKILPEPFHVEQFPAVDDVWGMATWLGVDGARTIV